MLKSYFKIAWRNLAKHKVNTVINVLGLSIGISACLIIYLITSFELSYDDFHRNKERIYRVVSDDDDNYEGGKMYFSHVPYHTSVAIRNNFTGIERIATFYGFNAKVDISLDNKETKKFDVSQPSDIILVEPQYFDVFNYHWLVGGAKTALSQPFEVVLTESKAHKYFGNLALHDIIGKEVIYDDSLRVTVSGILKDFGKNTDLIFQDFISFSTIENSYLRDKNTSLNASQTFLKLAKTATPLIFEAQTSLAIRDMMTNMSGSSKRKVGIRLQPLSDLHFNALYSDYYIKKTHLPTLYGLIAIAAFILLIAAINFINLATAQSLGRVKEIGIRKVLGSNRISLIFQFLSETFIVVMFAVLFSIPIIYSVFAFYPSKIPPGVTFHVDNPYTLIFLLVIAFVTTLIAGFYPAKVLTHYKPALCLKGLGTQGLNQKSYLRKALIVFQFTVSILFIIGTILVGNQLHYMLNKDLGFKKDAVIIINTNFNYPGDRKYLLAEKIKQLSRIDNVSISQEPPEVNYERGGWIVRKDNGAKIDGDGRAGDENYIPLYGLKLLAGRNFNILNDKSDSLTEFVINETCSKQLGFKRPEDAIGHELQHGYFVKNELHIRNTGRLVGVLQDFYTQPLNKPVKPTYIFASKSLFYAVISVKLSTNDRQFNNFKATIASVQKAWKELYPEETFEYSFLDEKLARLYSEEQNTSQIISIAMAIAIFISCMGLFGLVSFTTERRIKEIGIRKVLGARVFDIVSLLSIEFVKLVVISIFIASPIGLFIMNKWLQDFANRITISWWIFVLSGLAAIFIALVTLSYEAIKAAIANPVKSLRAE